MSFADAMRAAGWGRDEEGDAARRERMAHAIVTPDDLEKWREVGRLSAESSDAVRDSINRAVRGSLRDQADRIAADARRMTPRRGPAPDWTVTDDPNPVAGHRLTTERTGSAVVARCECGRWDGGWTGPRSRRRVLDDHAAHIAAELREAGPIIVKAERLDQPKEIEP